MVTALAVACTAQDPDAQAPISSEPVSSEPAFNTVSVRFDDSLLDLIEDGNVQTKSACLNEVLADLGIERLERIFPDAGEYEARSRKAGLHRFYKVSFSKEVPVTKATSSLSEVPGVLSVRPERKIRLRSTFNDPHFKDQWHLVNKDYPKADIGLEEVWAQYTTGSDKVIVAVVDECVDPTHPDLKNNLWTDGSGHTGFNFVNNNWNMSIREGDEGHGTHVAGTVAAVNNNGTGVCSVAGGNAAAGIPGVRIQSAAIFSGENAASDANTANAIKWGADHGAVISQNSWGFYADADGDGEITAEELAEYKSWVFDDSDPLKAAIDYFIQYAGCDAQGQQRADSPMKGGLVFFAAGNEDIDWDYISSYEPVISVGAFAIKGEKASYSNYGPWVDVAAPGGGVTTQADVVWSTVPLALSKTGYEGFSPDGYGWVGTSMACPHASGVAALLVSYFGEPGFTAEMCREYLFAGLGEEVGGAKPIGRRLNARAAFEYGMAGGAPIIKLDANEISVHAHETVSVGVTVMTREEVTVTCTPGSSALSYDQAAKKLVIVGRNAAPGTYMAVIKATDALQRTAEATFTYTLLPNHAPKVISVPGNLVFKKLQMSKTLITSEIFSDIDGEELTCTAAMAEEGIVRVSTASGSIFVSSAGYGITSVELTATDALGEQARTSFMVAVVNPDNPVALYPSVVSTDAYITIDSETPVSVWYEVHSATGGLVMESSANASIFTPVHLDVSHLAPGRYTVDLTYSGKTHRVRMVKY